MYNNEATDKVLLGTPEHEGQKKIICVICSKITRFKQRIISEYSKVTQTTYIVKNGRWINKNASV